MASSECVWEPSQQSAVWGETCGLSWGSGFPKPFTHNGPVWTIDSLIFVFCGDSFENLISKGNPVNINHDGDCRPLLAQSTHTFFIMRLVSKNTLKVLTGPTAHPPGPDLCAPRSRTVPPGVNPV